MKNTTPAFWQKIKSLEKNVKISIITGLVFLLFAVIQLTGIILVSQGRTFDHFLLLISDFAIAAACAAYSIYRLNGNRFPWNNKTSGHTQKSSKNSSSGTAVKASSASPLQQTAMPAAARHDDIAKSDAVQTSEDMEVLGVSLNLISDILESGETPVESGTKAAATSVRSNPAGEIKLQNSGSQAKNHTSEERNIQRPSAYRRSEPLVERDRQTEVPRRRDEPIRDRSQQVSFPSQRNEAPGERRRQSEELSRRTTAFNSRRSTSTEAPERRQPVNRQDYPDGNRSENRVSSRRGLPGEAQGNQRQYSPDSQPRQNTQKFNRHGS